MNSESSHIFISRIFDAPRSLVYRAFTDPDHLATWWGPIGNSLPRDKMLFDVRPGGFQRWTEVVHTDLDAEIQVWVDLTDVASGDLLEGVMRVTGERHDGFGPFETRFRIEFYDEPDGRTRLDIHQWLPDDLAGPSEQGWREAFTKLDTALINARAAAATAAEGASWQS